MDTQSILEHGHQITSPPVHNALSIADKSNREEFLKPLKLHEQGKTTYIEMSTGLAESSIEKWTVDTSKMTMIFYDKAGHEVLVENIK